MPSPLARRNFRPSGLRLVSVTFSLREARMASAISLGGVRYASLARFTCCARTGTSASAHTKESSSRAARGQRHGGRTRCMTASPGRTERREFRARQQFRALVLLDPRRGKQVVPIPPKRLLALGCFPY